jgi:hypothetical protein
MEFDMPIANKKIFIENSTKNSQTFGIDKRNALFLKPHKQGPSLILLCDSEMPKSKNEYR